MSDGIDRKDDMKLSNGIEYLLSKLEMTISSTRKVQKLWQEQTDSNECEFITFTFVFFSSFFSSASTFSFLSECITLANCMTEIVVYGKAISNLSDDCRDATNRCIDLFTNYQTGTQKNKQ